MKKIAVDYLGCKLNQAECEAWSQILTKYGYEIAPVDKDTCLYILNTCSVTSMADAKSRKTVRYIRKTYPEIKIVVTGCSATEEMKEAGADLVYSNNEKDRLIADLLEKGIISKRSPNNNDHVKNRSMIEIQQGCPHFCTYCIVPYKRGLSVSRKPETVIETINDRIANNYREIVLTGTEIGLYSSEGLNLYSLTERILRECKGLQRLRLSSVQPFEVNRELLSLFQNDDRLCRHFHISAQSGSDKILSSMNRHYTREFYLDKLSLIRDMLPDATITTDFIVGFPGENDGDFEDSLSLVSEARFLRTHVFIFSPRKGTKAYSFPGKVQNSIQKERSFILREHAAKVAESVIKERTGNKVSVLFEQKETNGLYSGYSKEYIRVYMSSSSDLTGQIKDVELTELYSDGAKGFLI
jgi:threonylcarbamoyladenosine tRNA methylthiotransferase MtaB